MSDFNHQVEIRSFISCSPRSYVSSASCLKQLLAGGLEDGLAASSTCSPRIGNARLSKVYVSDARAYVPDSMHIQSTNEIVKTALGGVGDPGRST